MSLKTDYISGWVMVYLKKGVNAASPKPFQLAICHMDIRAVKLMIFLGGMGLLL